MMQMKKHVLKTAHLKMKMKNVFVNMYYENIALDDVDEKTCIIKTLHLMMLMKETCIKKTAHLEMKMRKTVF